MKPEIRELLDKLDRYRQEERLTDYHQELELSYPKLAAALREMEIERRQCGITIDRMAIDILHRTTERDALAAENAKLKSQLAVAKDILGEPDELERVQQFHEFLQGQLPDGVTVGNPPKMTAVDAFSVIWFLQEVAGLISDSIEMCAYCGTLFGSNKEGYIGEEKNYCSLMCEAALAKEPV